MGKEGSEMIVTIVDCIIMHAKIHRPCGSAGGPASISANSPPCQFLFSRYPYHLRSIARTLHNLQIIADISTVTLPKWGEHIRQGNWGRAGIMISTLSAEHVVTML